MKTLEIIWNNPRIKRLQPYNLKVEYRKGADNPPDHMSHPIPADKIESTCAVKVGR